MGLGGAGDLNQLAIWKIIEEYKIEKSVRTFEKVVGLSRFLLNKKFMESKEENG